MARGCAAGGHWSAWLAAPGGGPMTQVGHQKWEDEMEKTVFSLALAAALAGGTMIAGPAMAGGL